MKLRLMSQRDAVEFLEKSLNRKNLLRTATDTTELLEALASLPLAIAQAATYLNMNKMTIAKYVRLLYKSEQDIVSIMSKDFHDDTRYKGSPNAVAMTWMVSFKQIDECNVVAAELLTYMSCVEWKAILHSISPSVQPEARIEEAISMLCGYSFLARHEDNNKEQDGKKDSRRKKTVKKNGTTCTALFIWRLVYGSINAAI